MSEVMRWKLKGFLPAVEGECKAVFQLFIVLAEDFDRVTVERDALQLRLNAADQQIDELTAKRSEAEHERLMEIVERYPKGDPLQYNAAVNALRKNAQ